MQSILLVDDDEQVRQVLKEFLEIAGYQVRAVNDGKEASRLLTSWTPDLLLTDIVMPGKEGLELISELRRDHPEVPVIAMSGAPGEGSALYLKVAGALGAVRQLDKPISGEQLLQSVGEIIGATQKSGEFA